MKKKILTTVSIIALMSVSSALAGTAKADESKTEQAKEQVKEGWEKTTDAVDKAATDTADATKAFYKDFKAFVFSENDDKLDIENAKINTKATAEGIIGEPVYNAQDERVGVVKDIILDQNGKAKMVIVGDGDFFGMGKLAAFDYDTMVKMGPEGDIMMPISEAAIERAAEFSFDRQEMGENVRMMPENAYSVEKLLSAKLVNVKGENLGDVGDVTFKNGQASHLIVEFDKILGLGGEEISLAYDNAKLVKMDDEDYKVTLPQKKSSLITKYKSDAN